VNSDIWASKSPPATQDGRRRPAESSAAGAGSAAGRSAGGGRTDPERAVADLYQAHALGLIRLAVVMLGDRPAAEDVVQEAFCGLYRRWAHLADTGKALSYLRSSILNGCRSELRQRVRSERRAAKAPPVADAASAEHAALIGEEHHQVLTALRQLPRRQREALVLRFYLDLSEPEIATSMGISHGTVKSTTSRALAALGRLL
jgi:RNA polymerase sigma-70 factor (sigma-E family)